MNIEEEKTMRCNNWDCPICRWGRCVGDREAAKEYGWCDRENEEEEQETF